MRHIALAGLIGLLLPGQLVRTDVSHSSKQQLTILPLNLPDADPLDPRLVAQQLWELRGSDPFFGGMSSIVAAPGGMLTAFSDRGTFLRFHKPGQHRPIQGESANTGSEYGFLPVEPGMERFYPDIEGAARDAESGAIWIAYESSNAIRRIDANGTMSVMVRPAAMRRWPDNSGAEAIVRLPGGRFLVLPESHRPALLFPSDPTLSDAEPIRMDFDVPNGFKVTDAGVLPDGRLLILTRKLERKWLPFSVQLFITNVPDPQSDEPWEWEAIAGVDAQLPRENYEGLEIEPLADGSATIWLISDDNLSALQRTLLVRLRWNPLAAN